MRALSVLVSIGFALASVQAGAQTKAPVVAPQPAQQDSGWRISPEKINIQLGDQRWLQVLDDSAQERQGAAWSVDAPDRADIKQEGSGRAVLTAKGVGTVRVSAVIAGQTRVREITIWPAPTPLPEGTTTWALHPIGRELRDLPAVPVDGVQIIFSLEQTADGTTYLRADRDDGIQVWVWKMPGSERDVELVCGDWLGGAMISANHQDSYTIYIVGNNGALRWQYDSPGHHKGHAISVDHLVHLISQSTDGTVARLTGLDGQSGEVTFDITLPPSVERQVGVRRQGATFICASGNVSIPLPVALTRLLVNIDGHAYLGFTESSRILSTTACAAGSTVNTGAVVVERDDKLRLWQVHDDGTLRSTVVEAFVGRQPFTSAMDTVSPTGAIIPNNIGGTLLSVRRTRGSNVASSNADEFIYSLDAEGAIVYKLPLPKYSGRLHDEMVIGENDVAFATRGGMLIAFDIQTGKERWHWESLTPEIEVFAALANGHCAVQTPTALVEVADSRSSMELARGKAMLDWMGRMYISPVINAFDPGSPRR